MAEFGDGMNSLGDEEVQTALAAWKAGFDRHLAELQGIVRPLTADQTMASPEGAGAPGEKADELGDELNDVKAMRAQLESQRTGRDVEEVTSAWADPEETEKEVAELRRVRRQIRYLFGGMIGNLPETTNLRVDDLIGPDGADAEPVSPKTAAASRPPRLPGDASYISPTRGAEAGYVRTAVAPEGAMPVNASPRQVRPRSGGTESVGTNSSASTTWNSNPRDADEEHRRRAERRARREARKDAHREMKKDDGAMPAKQYNWAEEVVKASMDPGNQWEFPGAEDTRNSPKRPGHHQWEQPRVAPMGAGQRGTDIALKARERAEQVMRSERDRQRNDYDPSDQMPLAGYR
jgi:hypothetical protein